MSAPRSTEALNKDTVRRLIAAFAANDVDGLGSLLAPTFRAHGMPPGLSAGADGMKQMAALMHAGLQNCQLDVEQMVAEGDTVVVRYTTRATHGGELFGVPASGRPVTLTGIEIYRLTDGKVVEYWAEADLSDLFQGAADDASASLTPS